MAEQNQTWQRRKAASIPGGIGIACDFYANCAQPDRHHQILFPLTIPDGLLGEGLAILM